MKSYKVRVTDQAFADLNAIYEYIDQELLNPDAAVRIYNALIDGMRTLENMPERIKLMNSELEQKNGLRLMPVENYAIIFTIREDNVYITNIFYGASDIESKLRGENNS